MPTATVKSRNPDGGQPLDHHRDDLGVGSGAAFADELDAELAEAAHLAAQRLVLAEDLGGVAEAQRAGFGPHARRDEPRDRHGHVGTKRKQPAVGVDEPKRDAVQVARGGLERHQVLDDGRLDQLVAPRRGGLGERPRHALALGGLGREHISESSGGDGAHGRRTCPLGVDSGSTRVAPSGTLSQ